MLLRSAPVQAAFDVWDADKTDQQPRLDASEADATSELTAADIVEVEVTDLRAAVDLRRPRITRVRPPSFERAKDVLAPKPSRLPPPRPPPTRRTVPAPPESVSEVTLPDHPGASSIAPMAIDLDAPCEPLPGTLPARTTYESMSELERAAGLPQRPGWQTALTLGVTGVLVALSLVSALALRSPPRAFVVATPHAPSLLGAHEAVVVPVLTAPSKDELELDEPSTATIAAPLRASTRTGSRRPRSRRAP
jgi:hypothetical protein